MMSVRASIDQPKAEATNFATPRPITMPMAPPIAASTSDSIRNWARISPGCAPTAMRMPISRVRSVTDTSMMFMTPIPPTTSETSAIAASRLVKVSVALVNTPVISAMVVVLKSSSSSGARRCRSRSSPAICSRAGWMDSLVIALT